MFSGTDAPSRALIDTCVHCGFCLPTCPTYVLWGEEMDSPRGRIYLMKAGLDGRAEMSASFVQHFDRCLGCLACVTACPSGVQYGPLIEKTRTQIERSYERDAGDWWFRRLLLALVPYPARLRFVLAPLAAMGALLEQPAARRLRPDAGENPSAALAAPGRTGVTADAARRVLSLRPWLVRVLPERLRALLLVAPRVTWRGLFASAPQLVPAAGPSRATVGLLTGCVQRLVFGGVNDATVRVLAAEGCTVIVPPAQGCCGALPLHAGHLDRARALARRTIEVFDAAGVDRVVVNAAGCGSAMKEYGELFADDAAWAGRARAFSAKVRDVSELLVELGEPRAERHPIPARVVYHDACHLAHGQGVRAQPRRLLQGIPGVEVLSPVESEICCGSAGIYNLVQPEAAAQLGARKADHIAALAPDVIATANPGCILQIAAAARRRGHDWPIVHPIELLDASIRG
jgi:glycolate oxidase iron-sulfur subunit